MQPTLEDLLNNDIDVHGLAGDGRRGRYGTCVDCGRHRVVGPLEAEPGERRCITPRNVLRLRPKDQVFGCNTQVGPRPEKRAY